MTKIAYWDCPTGIAGDMCLGALVGAGLPLAYLQDLLVRLAIDDQVQLSAQNVQRQGQAATQVCVEITASQHQHRHLPQILEIIDRAELPTMVRQKSVAVFQELAAAEGQVHGLPPHKVHFHEVGALDAIIDIVGTCAGLHWLGIDQIFASVLPKGGGYVNCDHGRLAVPTPAVLQLYQKHHVPLTDNGIAKELVTPTGAALLVTLCDRIGYFPPLTIDGVGLGAGSQELPIANIVRLVIGTETASSIETVIVLETQIDDLSPQVISFATQELLCQGALDVYTQPIYMKKGRLGTLITVICTPDRTACCEAILFDQTTTLGIRRRTQERITLPRHMVEQSTPWGNVAVKIAHRPDGLTQQPEYEDCARLARQYQVPVRKVQAAVNLFNQNPVNQNPDCLDSNP